MQREARKTHHSSCGIEFELERKRVKNINLRVRQDGSVFVSAPTWVPLDEVNRFVASKSTWIERRRAALQARPLSTPSVCHDGDTVFFWGDPLVLRVTKATSTRSASCTRVADQLVIAIPPRWEGDSGDAIAHRQKLVTGWLTEQLSAELPALFAHYETRMGVHASQVRLRSMKTRWGSCNVKTGSITLNTQLAALPRMCLESVVVHELCHLLEPSHNQRFYALMDRFYPTWKTARTYLKGRPPSQ